MTQAREETANEITRTPKGKHPRRKEILVTGGAGFLGSHLCETLVRSGNRVTCMDNFHTGRRANVERLLGTGSVTVVEHDIVVPLPSDLPQFDEIYNLACPASPPHYQADPVKTAMTNALGAMNVLNRARRDGARVFQASTSEIYGDPEIHPQPESYAGCVNTVGPRSCYDEGKRFAETLFTDFGRQYAVTVRIARIFNTYGPRMQPDDGRVVSNFIVQALQGRDITIYGDGSQTRSFCYVDDLVRGFKLLMEAENDISGPVNLGNPVEVTVSQLAETVVEMIGSGSRVVYLDLPVDDPRRRKPDISKAENLLDWRPAVSLADGLSRTIAHFETQLAARRATAAKRDAPVPSC